MVMRISAKIRIFLIILFCLIAGFAGAFFLLLNKDTDLNFGSVADSFYRAFLYLFGISVDTFVTNTAAANMAIVIFIFFILTMNILMLNLLIALMGNTFAEVRDEGEALLKKQRAEIILEERFHYSDSPFTKKQHNKNKFSVVFCENSEKGRNTSVPKHVFVLKYNSELADTRPDYKKLLEEIVPSGKKSVKLNCDNAN
jgi:uncharacterized membrane protein